MPPGEPTTPSSLTGMYMFHRVLLSYIRLYRVIGIMNRELNGKTTEPRFAGSMGSVEGGDLALPRVSKLLKVPKFDALNER